MDELLGTWTVESVGPTPTPDGVTSTITFDDEGHVFGRAGVNRVRGSWSAEPTDEAAGVLLLTPMATTMMFGPEDAMAHERALLAVLAGALPFRVDGDVLHLGPDPEGITARRQASVDTDGDHDRRRVTTPTTEVVLTGTGVPHVVLTHLIPPPDVPGDAEAFERDLHDGGYTGPVTVGEDLLAVAVGAPGLTA